ncbi:MAG: FAD-binding oxidoreductase [Rhizobiaceae bacterium]|nr:FAD-binding oxidoreductase [Rhizobiaceae bacterium]
MARAIVIGGGIVGISIALGLADAGLEVTVLDGDDADTRASYGNAGLIWVQSKGVDHLPYARLSRWSAALWPGFAGELLEATGIDVEYTRQGGMSFCLDEAEVAARRAMVAKVAAILGEENDVEFVDGSFVRERMPDAGPAVLGASWCPSDGHVNPLLLMGALRQLAQARGATIITNRKATRIGMDGSHLTVYGDGYAMRADRAVVAAGLATGAIAATAGMTVPIRPIRGQVVVTERIAPRMEIATTTTRQARAGSMIFGNSHEDIATPGTTLPVIASHAQRAIAEFPFLASVRVLRSWGGIRVMPRDGMPVYASSKTCPGAYAVACHSGITLTAVHAKVIGAAMAAGKLPADVSTLTDERFDAVAAT